MRHIEVVTEVIFAIVTNRHYKGTKFLGGYSHILPFRTQIDREHINFWAGLEKKTSVLAQKPRIIFHCPKFFKIRQILCVFLRSLPNVFVKRVQIMSEIGFF